MLSRKPMLWLFAATAAAALAIAPAARAQAADVTIGSNLAGAATHNICSGGISCTYIQTSGGTPIAVSPVDGTVVRWRLKAGSFGGDAKLRVLRPSGGSYTAVASSATMTVTSDLNTFTTSLAIKAGDVVALDNSTSGIFFTDSPSVPLPLVLYFQPALADGASGAPNNQVVNRELLMNADVTPTIPGAPPPPPPPAPAISKLKLRPSKFRSARSGGSVARKRRPPVGTTVRYTLSTDATVRFKAQRAKKGRRRGGKCRKAGKRARGRRCTRYVRVRGSLNVGGTAGANAFRFRGRLANRKLARGRYRMLATPSSAGRKGNTARARFRVG